MAQTLPRDENDVALQGTYKTIADNRKAVTTAGTRVQLVSTSTSCKRIDVQALFTNTKTIAVGSSTVVAAPGTERGVILQAGGSYTFFITDVSAVYIDSEVNGEGVTFTYFD